MSPAIQLLATKYRARRIGRSPSAARDLIIAFNDLLKEADCLHGPARAEAEREFRALQSRGVLKLECASRDVSAILKVRVSVSSEAVFFEHVGEPGPNTEREHLAILFDRAAKANVPARFMEGWGRFCQECAEKARGGASLAPCFDRTNIPQVVQILGGLPRLLAWEGESLRRFASAVLFGNSKILEALLVRAEACLARLSGGQIRTLAELGIRQNPRSVILHGSLTLNFPGSALNIGALSAPVRIAAADVGSALLSTRSHRCLTVENAATLHELAKFRSDVILASSGSEGGFAHTAVIDFLRALPAEIDLYHFGDSDPAGFDILRDLRERTGRTISSLHMHYRPAKGVVRVSADESKTIKRLLQSTYLTSEEKTTLCIIAQLGDKGSFEQESLGIPSEAWPFYREQRARAGAG
jgi:hypothetical protein